MIIYLKTNTLYKSFNVFRNSAQLIRAEKDGRAINTE